MPLKTAPSRLLIFIAFVITACGCSAADTLSKPSKVVTPSQRLPAQCLSMDISPYSNSESLVITNGAHQKARFNVEIANNYATREQGLMCRAHIDENQGMLFEFPDVDNRNFWMHNTLIALDIIYIAPNGKIVSIQKNAQPLDRTPLPSKGAASGVLEIKAGLSDKLGLATGDMVIHPFFPKP